MKKQPIKKQYIKSEPDVLDKCILVKLFTNLVCDAFKRPTPPKYNRYKPKGK
jgi:hypothetical protein